MEKCIWLHQLKQQLAYFKKYNKQMSNKKVSFKQLLQDTYDENLWRYYSDVDTQNNRHFTENYLTKSKEFIKGYIGIANKYVSDVELTTFIDKLQEWRAQHIVSTFLTGCYLYDRCNWIKEKIDEKFVNPMKKCSDKETIPLKCSIKFQFIWFLICLFHDLGYEYENGKSTNSMKMELPIDPINNISPPVPPLYTSIYEKYMLYREKEHNKKDHGIYGGLRLYHDLCNLRKNEVNKIKEDDKIKRVNLTNFLNGETLSDGLFFNVITNQCDNNEERIFGWHKTFEHSYNYAAWVILAHNIWYVKEGNPRDENLYKEYGLGDLIIKDGNYPITLSEYPLLFLFCLVDTIEPIKKIINTDLLENIYLSINEREKKIVIETELKCSFHDSIIRQAKNLNDWLTPTEQKGNSVEINLKGNEN